MDRIVVVLCRDGVVEHHVQQHVFVGGDKNLSLAGKPRTNETVVDPIRLSREAKSKRKPSSGTESTKDVS